MLLFFRMCSFLTCIGLYAAEVTTRTMDGTTQLSAEDLMGWSKARELASQQGKLQDRPLFPRPTPSWVLPLFCTALTCREAQAVFASHLKHALFPLSQSCVAIVVLYLCRPSTDWPRQGHSRRLPNWLNIYQPDVLPSEVVSECTCRWMAD